MKRAQLPEITRRAYRTSLRQQERQALAIAAEQFRREALRGPGPAPLLPIARAVLSLLIWWAGSRR